MNSCRHLLFGQRTECEGGRDGGGVGVQTDIRGTPRSRRMKPLLSTDTPDSPQVANLVHRPPDCGRGGPDVSMARDRNQNRLTRSVNFRGQTGDDVETEEDNMTEDHGLLR